MIIPNAMTLHQLTMTILVQRGHTLFALLNWSVVSETVTMALLIGRVKYTQSYGYK